MTVATQFWAMALLVAMIFVPIGSRAGDNTSIDIGTGRVVVGATGASPVLIWDASALTTSLFDKGMSRDEVLHELEARSVKVMMMKISSLPRVNTIVVRIMYARSEHANENYGSTTYQSFALLATVTARANRLHGANDALIAGLRAGKPPDYVSINENATATLP